MTAPDQILALIAESQIIQAKQFAALLGVDTATLARMRRCYLTPIPLRISERRYAWRLNDVLAWLESLEPNLSEQMQFDLHRSFLEQTWEESRRAA